MAGEVVDASDTYREGYLKALEDIREKIDTAYRKREDYPPYKLTAWDDRAIFYQYIYKLIDELMEEVR